MGGQWKGVGVVDDQAHVVAGTALCTMAAFLVTEPLCSGQGEMVSMCLCKLGCLKSALGSEALLGKLDAHRALAQARMFGKLNMWEKGVNMCEHR